MNEIYIRRYCASWHPRHTTATDGESVNNAGAIIDMDILSIKKGITVVATPVELVEYYTLMLYRVSICLSVQDMQNKKKKHKVCKLKDLNESGSYGWSGELNNELIQCILILHRGKVYSYLNRCPHTGVNLRLASKPISRQQ